MKEHPISIIVATYNQGYTIKDCVNSLVELDYNGNKEIIVIDDGSTEPGLLKLYGQLKNLKGVEIYVVKHMGGVAVRNLGVKLASNDFCLLLGGDCILKKGWLRAMMFYSKKDGPFGFVSAYGPHGGNATIYSKKALCAVGCFDEDFNKMGSGYHDDSDVFYKLKDKGYKTYYVNTPQTIFIHKTVIKQKIFSKVWYASKRVLIHKLDPLLYKKHPVEFKRDFHVRYKYFVSPVFDFKRATGLWRNNGKFELSSPQGVTLIRNNGPISCIMIGIGGILYVVALKCIRLVYSIRFGTLIV